MPPPATSSHARLAPYYLAPFDNLMAPLVARWPRSAQELFWLAPKTPAPLTPAKVVGWPGPSGGPLLFYRDGLPEPLGYIELNPMPGERDHLWIGHCLVRPDCRSRGLGRRMVCLVLDEAFCLRRAGRVSLVVFPDNSAAIRCYKTAGFLEEGEQLRYFATTGRQHVMIQMSIDTPRHAMLKSTPAESRGE